MVHCGKCGKRPQFQEALCPSSLRDSSSVNSWSDGVLLALSQRVSVCMNSRSDVVLLVLSQWPFTSGNQRVPGLGQVWWVLLQRVLVNETGQQDHAAVYMSVKLQDCTAVCMSSASEPTLVLDWKRTCVSEVMSKKPLQWCSINGRFFDTTLVVFKSMEDFSFQFRWSCWDPAQIKRSSSLDWSNHSHDQWDLANEINLSGLTKWGNVNRTNIGPLLGCGSVNWKWLFRP